MSKFTIEFGPRSTARLEDLAFRLETSRTEVVRRALEHYEDYVLQRDEQHQSRRAEAQLGESSV
jgi:predicted transcriptional regulator